MMLETDLFRGELPLGIDGDAARPPHCHSQAPPENG
jgi:hypothetical protein